MTNKTNIQSPDIMSGIRRDLKIAGPTGDQLSEAYVALPKKFTLNTELLGPKTKHAHEEKYQAYIKALNSVSAKLDVAERKNVSANTSPYRALKGDEVRNMNAVYLHELYFANISDVHSQIDMDTLSYMRLERDFGTFDDWQFDMIAAAMASRDGWAVTAYSTFLQRYITFFIDEHDQGIPVGCYPIIVIDVWEHAYFRDYLNDRKAYIFAMLKELRWDVIEERVKRAEKIALAVR